MKEMASFSKEDQVVDAFKTILDFSMDVTRRHVQNREGNVWSMSQNLVHCCEEIGEVNQALRFGSREKIIEEMCDIILCSFTNFNIYRLELANDLSENDWEDVFENAVRANIRKLLGRVNDKEYKAEYDE